MFVLVMVLRIACRCCYMYRVEDDEVDKRKDSPMIVLFTGISQSVVKNLKQVCIHISSVNTLH